ncbi:hypothetical protein HF680_13885 [Brevundimonas sp. WCHBH090558]|uniref:hypothetical protein n=1 Tax=Brevundimonas huaxiensis TaxID=2725493 RepID=UPI001625626C|nr:hypothetical protein [Brevundimonas huaxiensis]MBC1183740.1 hypothetical protein [Brevundimonas huaxiensis]
MIRTGTATVPAAPGKRGSAALGNAPRSSLKGRHPLTLTRPGEQRKDTCVAVPGSVRLHDVQGVEVAFPIAVVRRQFPAPVLGLMENPAVERRPFRVACVAQMETFSHA